MADLEGKNLFAGQKGSFGATRGGEVSEMFRLGRTSVEIADARVELRHIRGAPSGRC